MPKYQQQEKRIATVREALETRTVDDLKKLKALLPEAASGTRKDELLNAIIGELSGDKLRLLWDRLDDLQQKAVAETVYSDSPVFIPSRFKAKYGELPDFGTNNYDWGYRAAPTLLRLFLYASGHWGSGDSVLPDDLKTRLLEFVPKPEPLRLKTSTELHEFIERIEKEYEFDEETPATTLIHGNRAYVMRKPKNVKDVVYQIPIVRRDNERAAQQDLLTLLRLIDKGKVSVSEKTYQASAATMKEITSLLRDGDFYEWKPKESKWEQEIGPIKAFAWPLLLQAGKLVQLNGKKLALTKAGRNALAAKPAETLRSIWQRWLKSKLLDEFNRVDAIKGQYSKGHPLTAVEDRREVINNALKKCPIGQWIKFDDFSSFMQAAAFDFKVARDFWKLYIVDANYGHLGDGGGWNILQARYLMALLFEYAATLGLIDVAYIDPEDARQDYKKMWGAEDLDFLSRYDGLMYFRLTPLGAYCLELTDNYTPLEIEASASFTVLPSLQINVSGGEFSPDETLLLETYAEKESDTVWRLSQEKALSAVESGSQIKELRDFLAARDEQELPDTVEGFFATTERRAKACINKGTALLIECADAEIAERVATHEKMKKLCLRAGEKHLVVIADAEEQFRKALRLMGYGMPRI
jgi:hypothetical protein